MAIRKYNRTFQYVFPMLSKYPIEVLTKLQKAGIQEVYLGNTEIEEEGLHIVLNKPVEKDYYIIKTYYSFKLKKNVAVIKILEIFKNLIKYFWKGEYDKMYSDLDHIPRSYGNKVNRTYHVLSNSNIGKKSHKKMLLKYNYVDIHIFNKNNDILWKDFLPLQSDFKPSRKEEILNYTPELINQI